METVNNIASAASKAIWGDSNTNQTTTGNETAGREPIAGEVGDTKNGEPYDKGNTEPTTSSTTNGTTTESEPKIAQSETAPGNTASTGPLRPEHDTDKTGVTSAHNPTSATSSDKPTSSNDNSGPGAAPSVSPDATSGAQETSKQQGADKPHDEPSSGETDRIRETKKEAEDASVDVSGPGPKTLEEKAKEEGGASGIKSSREGAGGDDDGPQTESHGEGTGEKYVKSSGMKADGGDFDAANPGAGKEADRLLETKGIHHEAGVTKEPESTEAEGTHGADGEETTGGKLSLKDKIKAKLHKH